MDLGYALTPVVAWLVAGSLKFAINSIKAGRWAFGQIGYGGFPSTHAAIVTGIAGLIALREGIGHPAFGVAVAVCFVVILDATSLRRQIGLHARAINRLTQGDGKGSLRERMGHTFIEVGAGTIVGILTAIAVDLVLGSGVSAW
jgi:uncharacterized protein